MDDLKQDCIHPTQEEREAYPKALIDIIHESLSTYQDFLEKSVETDYKQFINLDPPIAQEKFYQCPAEEQIFLRTQPTSIPRDTLDEQFLKRLNSRMANLLPEQRKALNTEFRWMISVVLYTLLLTIRKNTRAGAMDR